MAEYDFDEAKRLILTAADKWLVKDIYDLEITGIEEEYLDTLPILGQPQTFKGIRDITGVIRGRLNATKNHAGKKVVIDWKTTYATLDTTWKDRYADSWQWKKYAHFGGADIILFRGVNRKGETKEIFIEVPKNNSEDVNLQLTGLVAERRALIESGLDVWPRRMPSACGSYGRECPYFEDCRTLTMPRGVPFPADKSFSYSSMDVFMNCPERNRRAVVESALGAQEVTDESDFGVAVHAGLAELYTQANELFIKTNG
jgi:hypothetical protein